MLNAGEAVGVASRSCELAMQGGEAVIDLCFEWSMDAMG
jgi:hypothetical protein